MWSPLGSSAMSSSTLRGSLSVNDIPLLFQKNRLAERKRNSSTSGSSSSSFEEGRVVRAGEEEEEADAEQAAAAVVAEDAAADGDDDAAQTVGPTRPQAPPRNKRNAKDRTRNNDDRTLTPGSETGAGRLLEKGRCVSMPSVVSTPHTPRHHLLVRQQQQQQHNHGKTTGSHHRRFKRRFPQVNDDEGLVDYYSCALVADILLQGILYVGERHFAFYSNIFGHKKHLLIPAQNVLKITKERTARFIPNAVGIATAEHKFVFASLLSRDATFKAIYEVWSRCTDMDISLLEDSDTENVSPVPQKTPPGFTGFQQRGSEDGEDLEEEEDSSPSEVGGTTGQTVLQDRTSRCLNTTLGLSPKHTSKAQGAGEVETTSNNQSVCDSVDNEIKVEGVSSCLSKMPRTNVLLIASTLLLVALFASATVLVYRIAVVQKQIHGVAAAAAGTNFRLYPETSAAHKWKAYQELSHRQNKVLSEEVGRLTSRLQEHVKHLHQMRLPLEELAATASKMPDFCTLNPIVNGRGQQQQPQQTPQPTPQQTQAHHYQKSQLHQEQNQWATYAAT